MKNVLCLGLLIALGTTTCFAQIDQEKAAVELKRTMDHQRSLTMQLDSAILLSHQGQYALADKKFLFVLKNMRSIPSDLTYHFGLNSYYLGKYKQSIDWFNKYIQLKGTNGQYSEKANEWLELAQRAVQKELEAERKNAPVVVASNEFTIDCGPTDRVTCPVCEGTTVIIKKGYLGDTYKTCGFCSKKGYLNCDEFNKLLKGELKASAN